MIFDKGYIDLYNSGILGGPPGEPPPQWVTSAETLEGLAFDIKWGDPAYRGDARASLGALDQGAFYAVEIKSGALGTKSGPQTE